MELQELKKKIDRIYSGFHCFKDEKDKIMNEMEQSKVLIKIAELAALNPQKLSDFYDLIMEITDLGNKMKGARLDCNEELAIQLNTHIFLLSNYIIQKYAN